MRWTSDTTVSGHASWDQLTGRMRAWLTVTASGGTSAALRLHYLDYTSQSMVTLSGSIHGQAIMATMPAPETCQRSDASRPLDTGVLEDVGGDTDDIQKELDEAGTAAEVDRELAALKAQIGPGGSPAPPELTGSTES